ncbi:TPA: hypothetical protein ONC18_000445 [Enterobacter kobei]|nr:hypothetical protein [Enterobacter kobei]
MAKPLLRSGQLDDFQALGENGQTIFESALPLRETLRLRKQQDLLNCLAIPQLYEADNRVNWYAPLEGNVIAWSAASESEQRAALCHLEDCYAALAKLIQHSSQAQNVAVRLFAAMLHKAFRFPGSQFIYLVAGKPVVTFWGFATFEQPSGEEPLACLRSSLNGIPPAPVEKVEYATAPVVEDDPVPEAASSKEEETDFVVSLSQLSPSTATAQQADPLPAASHKRQHRRIYYSLLGIVLAACGTAFAYHQPKPVTHEASPSTSLPSAPLHPPLPEAAPVKKTTLAPSVPTKVIVPHDTPAPATVNIAQPTNALQLPANDLKVGSTRFLNGRWHIEARDPRQKQHDFPAMRLLIAGDRGSAHFATANHATCIAEMRFGLMQSGNLIFKSYGKAKCSNNTRVEVPDVICNRDLQGVTQCKADYGDGDQIALNIRKVKG